MDVKALYIRRIIDRELDELGGLPAISLEGAKGVGKTETAIRRAKCVFRLGQPQTKAVVEADLERIVEGEPPTLIDEWQRIPQVLDRVRQAIDANPQRRTNRFLLTGSAPPLNATLHSGAGRIVTIHMRPLSLAERGGDQPSVSLSKLISAQRPFTTPIAGSTTVRLEDYVDGILNSGFPGLRYSSSRELTVELEGYLRRIAERDFEEMGHRIRNPSVLFNWLRSYAAATATTASYEAIRDSATPGEGNKPSRTTTQPYRDVLTRLWIVEPLPAWLPSRRRLTRLAAAPKHHLVDPALAARLLDVTKDGLIFPKTLDRGSDRPLLGALFESLVTQSIRVYSQASQCSVAHLRTRAGEREVDLIVSGANSRTLAFEIKLAESITDKDVRHLHWLRSQLGEDLIDAAVITTGQEAYRRKDGIAVIPAKLIGP